MFEVQKDGKCLMNVPDPENGKYQQEYVHKIPFASPLKVILVYHPKDDWNFKIYRENRLEAARKYADTQEKLIAKQKEESKTIESSDEGKKLAKSLELEKQQQQQYDEKQKQLKSLFLKISGKFLIPMAVTLIFVQTKVE